MSAEIAHELQQQQTIEQPGAVARSARARIVLGIGWLVTLAGVVWALAQPYRLTLLHPRGEGFWWLFVEPPLLVVVVGLLFYFVVLPGLLEDLEADRATAL